MCEAAREAGVKVLLSGMGADELFGGYRKHLANMLAATLPAHSVARSAPVWSPRWWTGCRSWLAGRGIRTVRWAKRFLTFAELPEEEAFRRSYTLYDPGELVELLDPALQSAVDDVVAGHTAVYDDNELDGRGQPHVPGRHPDVPAGTEPRLHRPGQHGGVHRGPGAVRRPVRVRRCVLPAGQGEDPGPPAEGGAEGRRAAWLPDEIIDRPKASFGAPLRAWVTNDLRELVDDVLVRR